MHLRRSKDVCGLVKQKNALRKNGFWQTIHFPSKLRGVGCFIENILYPGKPRQFQRWWRAARPNLGKIWSPGLSNIHPIPARKAPYLFFKGHNGSQATMYVDPNSGNQGLEVAVIERFERILQFAHYVVARLFFRRTSGSIPFPLRKIKMTNLPKDLCRVLHSETFVMD